MKKLGLIGKKLNHSFSKKYFDEKFKEEKLNDWKFDLYELDDLDHLEKLIQTENLSGFSVTIPYKLEVMQLCSALSQDASSIGAVNCVKIYGRKLNGYNTDWLGFRDSLDPSFLNKTNKALVCGTGGASRAIIYALRQMDIEIIQVSSSGRQDYLKYEDLNDDIIRDVQIIINCTHLGTFPNIKECISIPYEFINSNHYCYDLVYNPEETLFLKKCKEKGARVQNGYQMLVNQAELAWEIWTEER